MSSIENSQSSDTGELQLPGQVNQLSPVEQLPFPSNSQFAVKTTSLLDFTPSPGFTGPLVDPSSSTGVTGVLPDIQTGALPTPSARNTTTALRQPIVIRATSKKKSGGFRLAKGRRWVVSASVVFLMMVISLGTAMAVAPTGGETGHGFNPFQFVSNLVRSNSNNPNLVAQQAATATADTANTQQSGGGVYTPPPGPSYGGGGGGGGLNRFAFGECTYWANMRYHALTGYWVPWLGNAYQWYYGAQSYGWVVSSTPKVPSIMVLQPGVQGASWLGHVAIVESINSDGSVSTSNMNWFAGGGWDIVSYYTFHPGPGVSFLWHA